MGLNDYEREYKVAISMYPFLKSMIKSENVEYYFEMNKNIVRGNGVVVYIHIPFCDSICDFCIYNRIRSEVNIVQDYFNALIREIKMYANTNYVKSTKISAIYIGGGTPTALSTEQLGILLEVCRKEMNVDNDTEVTVEANPINANKDVLAVLKDLSVNRISAGIQTFNNSYRQNLGVMLRKKKVLEWIEMVAEYGFHTVAIDLMYALPNQNLREWCKDIELAVSLPINHLSIYELDVFFNTRLGKKLARRGESVCSGKEKYKMFSETQKILKENGYFSQIIPEFCQPNHLSKYWDYAFNAWTETIALGVSSFGFMNRYSYQNEESINKYIHEIHNNNFPIKYISEKATDETMAEREIIFSLRKGTISKLELENKKKLQFFQEYKKTLEKHIEKGLIVEEEEDYVLTTKGRYFQEDIAVDYMQSTFNNCTTAYKKLVLGTHQKCK